MDLARICATVNGVESLADEAWTYVQNTVERHTQIAHDKLKAIVRRLPQDSQGYVDFKSVVGQHHRNKFFREAKKVYDEWHQGIRLALGIPAWNDKKPWEKSLGQVPTPSGSFLKRVRHSVIRKAHALIDTHNVAEAHLVSARISGRGMPKYRGIHSRTTSILLRGLKGIVRDQEKSMIENVLRGLDLLPRNHANKLYDAATGLTLKSALDAVADQFSVGEMDQRQLKLSVQTHIRAMVRRIAGEAHVPGAKKWLMVPPTRKKDFAQPWSDVKVEQAFSVIEPIGHLTLTQGSGDSLGRHPGDQLIPVAVHDTPKIHETARKFKAKIRKRIRAR